MSNINPEPTLFTTHNLPEYQLQLTKIGVSKTQFDLSPYVGKASTRDVQEMINAVKLAYRTHRPK